MIIPARDEAARLPTLLACLARIDGPSLEIIVVDDGSTDSTAELAVAAETRVISTVPPEGWTGKAWACQVGAEAATGDVYVFLDADTEPEAGVIALLARAAAGGELVSAHPSHRVERLYELASAGPAVVALLGTGTGGPTRRRWWRRPVAFGPAVALQRATYERMGGHTTVRDEIVEDVARPADRRRRCGGPRRRGGRANPVPHVSRGRAVPGRGVE